jgi:hypothetical protein
MPVSPAPPPSTPPAPPSTGAVPPVPPLPAVEPPVPVLPAVEPPVPVLPPVVVPADEPPLPAVGVVVSSSSSLQPPVATPRTSIAMPVALSMDLTKFISSSPIELFPDAGTAGAEQRGTTHPRGVCITRTRPQTTQARRPADADSARKHSFITRSLENGPSSWSSGHKASRPAWNANPPWQERRPPCRHERLAKDASPNVPTGMAAAERLAPACSSRSA